MLKIISGVLSTIGLLLIVWDIFNEDIMILYNVMGLLGASFLLSGIADIKEKNKSTAYSLFLASFVLLLLFTEHTIGIF